MSRGTFDKSAPAHSDKKEKKKKRRKGDREKRKKQQEQQYMTVALRHLSLKHFASCFNVNEFLARDHLC